MNFNCLIPELRVSDIKNQKNFIPRFWDLKLNMSEKILR